MLADPDALPPRAEPPAGGGGQERATAPPRAPRSGSAVVAALVLPVALVALVVARALTGAPAAGAVDGWVLPLLRCVGAVAASTLLGTLLLLATALPARSPGSSSPGSSSLASSSAASATPSSAWSRGAHLAGAAAVVQLLAVVAQLALVGPHQAVVAAAAITAAAATVALLGAGRPGGAGLGAALAALSLLPGALASDPGLGLDHRAAVTGAWLLDLGVGAWLGGLVALAVLGAASAGPAALRGPALAALAQRRASIAVGASALAVVGGGAEAWVRVLRASTGLGSGAGPLVDVEVVALLVLVVLGAAGSRQRSTSRASVPVTARSWRLLGTGTVVLAAAVGVGAALAGELGSPRAGSSLAARATREAVPPFPATVPRLLAEPAPDLLWLVVVAALVACYAVALGRLRARGDHWPAGRAVCWFTGCAVLAWLTSFGPAAYMDLLFSAHMLVHMLAMMVVPPLLVIGAPVTVAVRTLRARTDGSRGPREWLLVLVHSRVAAVVSHPVVAAVVFSASLVVFYFSPLLGLALRTPLGHELMVVHFLAAGYLFCSALIGIDPGTARTSYPLRLVLLLATMASHAFFGVVLLSENTLLAAGWFSSLGLGVDALGDQRTGGAIAWSIGEIPTLALAIVLAVQWSRADDREARRTDRAADRDADAALDAYNAMLASRAGARAPQRPGAATEEDAAVSAPSGRQGP